MAELKVLAVSSMRSREGSFFTLIFPIILILLFGAIFSGGGTQPSTVYVQNLDAPGPAGTLFIHALNGSSQSNGVRPANQTWPINLIIVPTSENFTKYLSAHSASDGVVIPKGFSSAYAAHSSVNVTLYGNPASTTSAIVSGVTREIVNGFNLYGASGVHSVGVTSRTAVSQTYKYIDFLVPGLMGFSALGPMFSLTNVASSYKRDKIFKLLSLTPLTKTEWLMARIIWYVATTSLSLALMSVVGIYVFGAHIGFNWGVPMFLVVGPFFFVSLGMLVGTVSNSPEAAAVVGNLVTFPMMFLSGTFFPVSSMPMYLQAIAHILPLFYMIDGLTNTMIYGNFGPALFEAGILTAISVITFALAVRFFKWRED
jgi:ABC-2 type transport system permease protein